MSDNIIIYISIFTAFILLVFIIRLTYLPKQFGDRKTLMFCKLEVHDRKITLISFEALLSESTNLSNSSYEFIVLTDLNLFIHHQNKLPDNCFLIAFNASYTHLLKRAIPILMQENISMVIFIPILKSLENTGMQKKESPRMSDLSFVGEFEKYLFE